MPRAGFRGDFPAVSAVFRHEYGSRRPGQERPWPGRRWPGRRLAGLPSSRAAVRPGRRPAGPQRVRLAGDGPVRAGLLGGWARLRFIFGPPLRHELNSRRNDLEPGDEPRELVLGAVLERDARAAVDAVGADTLGVEVAGRMLQGQIAAGGQGAEEPGHDAPGVVLVRDEVQDPEQRQRDRLG